MLPAQPYLFISYASRDREQVQQVAQTLDSIGVRYWLDKDGIAGGTSYGTEIAEAIRSAAALLLICSEPALSSRNVKQEIQLAWKHERPYLPLLLEPVGFPADIEYWLEGSQWIERLTHPEHIWLPQLTRALHRLGVTTTYAGDLAADSGEESSFSSVITPNRYAAKTNLPTLLTGLLGRDEDIAIIVELIAREEVRLTTLTGPGGTGKTRLSLDVAMALTPHFADGVYFIDLAPVRDPDFVLRTIAQTLRLQEVADQPVRDTLIAYLRPRRLLLLLDNFEQLLPAARDVVEVLRACPSLRVLVTSRAALRVSGERELPIAPLATPERATVQSASAAARYAAVQLFVERAVSSSPGFTLTDANAEVVAEICRQLDGLPLALELAAARVKVLPPQSLLDRLTNRLRTLTSGARDLPARQQTLRDTIAWSYELLAPAEQVLFRRLAVFVGGCTLDTAEAVCNVGNDIDLDIVEGLASLVEHSMLRRVEGSGGEPRFVMLETIREYGVEQLAASGEEAMLREAHARAFVQLAEEAGPHTLSGGRLPWFERLGAEQGNLRAVLRLSIDTDQAEFGLRILGPLWVWYWTRMIEARTWADALLALPSAQPPTSARAKALFTACFMAWAASDFPAARRFGDESAALGRTLGEPATVVLALSILGGSAPGDVPRAQAMYDACIPLAEALGDPWLVGWTHLCHGVAFSLWGDMATVRVHEADAVQRYEQLGDAWMVAVAGVLLASAQLQLGALDEARRHLESGLPEFRKWRDWRWMVVASIELGIISRIQGDSFGAGTAYAEGLALCRDAGARADLPLCLEGIAAVAALSGHPERAGYLLGGADSAHANAPFSTVPGFEQFYQGTLAAVQSALDEAAFRQAWSAGQAQPVELLVADALALADKLKGDAVA